ncbi:MAG: LD-carboxypeptidase [Bacteroidetes bacterium 24-39-8]|jgi:muramoyltetrapeptide carboxypeptidase|nr:MAG: LD-carboxypeptidase [Sphingobacteriia bacterium 35-40-8]OYZ50308.1 MAG: LD-carboxypeptidase [Bacteroidetes bacterium 24-39-8]OZA66841.1 MAG: LD-carboxypeptidase [Sphingobacteriia bacterium 39-39-8]HQR92955.1 LD-carboxypeptidase [Sediminibacterium sp.]HQS53921.1 LD-carboxypeptidase [Sediminibacterium sp.]
MIKIPPYLKKGDTIALVCPAGFLSLEKARTCMDTLVTWGYKVKAGKTLGGVQQNYFSGTDAERLADLQAMMDDPKVTAILCGRGGYGVSRIIDALDFKQFKKHPKWIIGFSDITVLHAHLNTVVKTASIHAPMAGAFNDGGSDNEWVQSLRKALKGQLTNYSCGAHALNQLGKAQGHLIGGNLSLLVHLIGTASAIKTKGKILFIEDIGEHVYQVDRMFLQLKRAGLLEGLAGLIIGGFTDMEDTTVPFGKNVQAALAEHLAEYKYPICFDFPVSHAKENYALKIGILHELTVSKAKTTLKEIS